MIEKLQEALKSAEMLDESEQHELARAIPELIESIRENTRFEEDLRDPDYAAYVMSSLAAAEADVAAGRTMSLEDVRAEFDRKFKGQDAV